MRRLQSRPVLLLAAALLAPTSASTVLSYSGGRPTGSSWADALWFGSYHGLGSQASTAWSVQVSFTLAASHLAGSVEHKWLIYFGDSDYWGLAVQGANGAGSPSWNSQTVDLGCIKMSRFPYTTAGFTYTGTCPNVADGQAHTVLLRKTGSSSTSEIHLFVDGTQVATAPGSGDPLPELIATTRMQSLTGQYSTQCVNGAPGWSGDNTKRWINPANGAEGIVTCDTTSEATMRACGSSLTGASGMFCTYDLQAGAFPGTITSLTVCDHANAACGPASGGSSSAGPAPPPSPPPPSPPPSPPPPSPPLRRRRRPRRRPRRLRRRRPCLRRRRRLPRRRHRRHRLGPRRLRRCRRRPRHRPRPRLRLLAAATLATATIAAPITAPTLAATAVPASLAAAAVSAATLATSFTAALAAAAISAGRLPVWALVVYGRPNDAHLGSCWPNVCKPRRHDLHVCPNLPGRLAGNAAKCGHRRQRWHFIGQLGADPQ